MNGTRWGNLIVGGLAVVAVLVITQLMLAGGPAPLPGGFDEGRTLAAAEAEAEQAGKPVLVLVHADWCGPCQTFKRGALSDPQVGRWIAEHTVPVAVDAGGDPAAASALGVRVLPTLLLRRGGRTVDVREGVSSATRLLRWLEAHAATESDAAPLALTPPS